MKIVLQTIYGLLVVCGLVVADDAVTPSIGDTRSSIAPNLIAQTGTLDRARPTTRRPFRDRQSAGGKETVGLKPLTEMSASDRYKGQDGGLYGGGENEPPEPQRQTIEAALKQIAPLDASGRPLAGGVVGFISISMSNATQEFSLFKRLADDDSAKRKNVMIVDCAQ